ncbi:hypothetical protein C7H62_0841 [Mesoflavibacter sp. HG96]|nr:MULTISPECIES: DUF4301 family protein [unclassified Mesoflavibacter]QIJ88650.1 hypothetical protein C7H62_0841 [Mesoflavibacter sp. HG96]QIJ91378.1 hypothetical protein C7H56_0841 [Mesoflavibacter sp. HG37]
MKLSDKDLDLLEKKGISKQTIDQQMQLFKNGLPFINLKRAATVDDGIIKLTAKEENEYIKLYDNEKENIDIVKFVPASGAATRMFKFLFQFLDSFRSKEESINAYINRKKALDLSIFFIGLEKLPFFTKVISYLKEKHSNYSELSLEEKRILFITALLEEDQLNYSFYPKGILPFHNYKTHTASAFEEHLYEAAMYSASKDNAKIHFTISDQHKTLFEEEFNKIKSAVEEKTQTSFDISFSFQKQSTDTIAVTNKDEIVRTNTGDIYFRPSGHGALLSNLNDLNADLIFIKNIDNVVVSKYKKTVGKHKKILAGLLIDIKNTAFKHAKDLDEKDLNEAQLIQIATFLQNKLNVVISAEFEKYAKKYQIEYLKKKLNRPIRVCGMVKNEGEPGGGPFWVKDEAANISLQIVESAQIDTKAKSQKKILKKATHFNPVDIVCSIKNHRGEVYDLQQFLDPKAAFITQKTIDGKSIKALELPGLWNGSMSNWNTVFVEVPLATFNPVKNVNDLLKPSHQTN